MAFDTSCWKLAKSFLEDGPRCLSEDINELAQPIQDVCEAHCRVIEDQERGTVEFEGRQFVIYAAPAPASGENE